MANLQQTTPTGNGADHITPLIDDSWFRGPQPKTVAKTCNRLWRRYDSRMARLRALCTRRTLGSDERMLNRIDAMSRLRKQADEILDQIVMLKRVQS
jgi:hypothetical protein